MISPEFEAVIGEYVLSDGIVVECVSSQRACADWCRLELDACYNDIFQSDEINLAEIRLGYDGDFETIMSGCVQNKGTSWRELLIRDDMALLENLKISGTFLSCTAQDIVKYILICAGIEMMDFASADYGIKEKMSFSKQSGIDCLEDINAAFGIKQKYFIRDGVFYWGTKPIQKEMYVFSEDENILSLKKYGTLWGLETFAMPYVHHSQDIEVEHSQKSGIFEVKKVVTKSNEKGYVRTYLYF